MTKRMFSGGIAIAVFAVAPGYAAGKVPASDQPSLQAAPRSPESARSDAVTDAIPLSAADLDAYRGGATVVTGSQTLTATTTGNVLNGNFTGGSINLSGNALSNFSGIGNFAINTGAQVSLQSGLNLIVNVTP